MKIKSAAPSGVTLTTNTQYVKSDTKTELKSKVSGKWAHSSGFTLNKFEIANDGSVTTETSLTGAAPGLELEFKGNDSNKGDLSFTYKLPSATVSGQIDALEFKKASAGVVGGNGPFTAGVSTVFGKSFALDSVNATVGYTAPQIFGVVRSEKNFSQFSGRFSFVATPDVTIAGQTNYASSGISANLAAIYKCNPNTTIKVKADTSGTLDASVKQTFDKKFALTGTAQIPSATGFGGLKFGLNATLG